MAQQEVRQEVPTAVRNTPVLIASMVESILIIATYIAGFTTALWVAFPIVGTIAGGWWQGAFASVHYSLAIITGFGAAFLFALSYLSGRKDLFYFALATIISVGWAAAMGLTFYHSAANPFSITMGMSATVALISAVGCMVYSL